MQMLVIKNYEYAFHFVDAPMYSTEREKAFYIMEICSCIYLESDGSFDLHVITDMTWGKCVVILFSGLTQTQ